MGGILSSKILVRIFKCACSLLMQLLFYAIELYYTVANPHAAIVTHHSVGTWHLGYTYNE